MKFKKIIYFFPLKFHVKIMKMEKIGKSETYCNNFSFQNLLNYKESHSTLKSFSEKITQMVSLKPNENFECFRLFFHY